MEGYKATRPFFHDKQFYRGDDVDLGDYVNRELEKLGLVRFVFRPKIIMRPEIVTAKKEEKKNKPKAKRNVRKSKENF